MNFGFNGLSKYDLYGIKSLEWYNNKIKGILRPMVEEDIPAYSRMLKRSFNTWYWNHGWGQDYFKCREQDLAIFWQIYKHVSDGHCVIAIDPGTGAMMGACFYHPRKYHVSLGIMCVDPAYFNRGVGRQLVNDIIDYTERRGYDALRLVSSAINMNSFSLYNKAGFVPKEIYHTMMICVPASGMDQLTALDNHVRDAIPDDVQDIQSLELDISGICREADYLLCIKNPVECLHASVIEGKGGTINGFAASIKHPVLNMIGPAFSRTEEEMLALLLRELDRFRGESVLCIIPMNKRLLVDALYHCGAVNVELHLLQVRGKFQPFTGVNLPSFLPETG